MTPKDFNISIQLRCALEAISNGRGEVARNFIMNALDECEGVRTIRPVEESIAEAIHTAPPPAPRISHDCRLYTDDGTIVCKYCGSKITKPYPIVEPLSTKPK